jgi:vacuolar protein sorting-associated protein 13A/C
MVLRSTLFTFYLANLLKFRSILVQNPEEIPEPKDTAVGQDLYFEVLELQPIKLSLSFMRTERVSSEEK